MQAASPSHKNLEIEVLRGFAILFTVVLHLRVLLPADSAIHTVLAGVDLSVGVDLFLVISGFVITGSVIESSQGYNGPIRRLVLTFWIKRIFRLIPAAWTWVLLAGALQILLNLLTDLPTDLPTIAIESAAALANVMNWYTPYCIANEGGADCVINNWLGHYWSLSLEEQFYLLFPLLFFLLPRKIFVAVLLLALVAQSNWHRPFFTFAWYFKTDALCWGILLALLSRQNFYQGLPLNALGRPWLGKPLGLALLVLLPVLAVHVQGFGLHMKSYGVAVVALGCATIVWLASLEQNALLLGGRYNRFMLYLGSRSYSLYLSHLVIFLLLRDCFLALGLNDFGAASSVSILILGLGMSLLASEITYRHVESRFRGRGREIAAQQLSMGFRQIDSGRS